MTHHSILYREQKRKYRKQKYLNKVKKKKHKNTLKKNPTYTQKYLQKETKKSSKTKPHTHKNIFGKFPKDKYC